MRSALLALLRQPTGTSWRWVRYGYEKYAIHDERGTEIGFVHRQADAEFIVNARNRQT